MTIALARTGLLADAACLRPPVRFSVPIGTEKRTKRPELGGFSEVKANGGEFLPRAICCSDRNN
ncbi:MAG: hypothetical protein Q7S40_31060, partial [Opitutaceae bacterium]|nr:hypothetical protein [Opitutaceae bacterium]